MNIHTLEEKYWIGPYGILVSNKIDSIPSIDGCNILFCNGNETEMVSPHPLLTEAEYKQKYAKFNTEKNKWYYFESDTNQSDRNDPSNLCFENGSSNSEENDKKNTFDSYEDDFLEDFKL